MNTFISYASDIKKTAGRIKKGFGVRLAILQYRLTLFIRKRLVNNNYASLTL